MKDSSGFEAVASTSIQKTERSLADMKQTSFTMNWFDLETRTRKMVYEVVQPLINRCAEDRSKIFELSKKVKTDHNRRIEELEYVLFKTNQSNSRFDEIFTKISEVDLSWRQEQSDLYRMIEKNTSAVSAFSFRVDLVDENLINQKSLSDRIQTQVKETFDAFSLSKDSFIAQIQQFQDKSDILSYAMQKELAEFKNRTYSVEIKLRTAESHIEALLAEGNVTRTDIAVLVRNVQNLEMTKVDETKLKAKLERIEKNFEIISEDLIQKENHLITIENFVEKYVPIRVQAQISENLVRILSQESSMMKRHIVFEKEKFGRLHEIILLDEDGIPNLLREIQKMDYEMNHLSEQSYDKLSSDDFDRINAFKRNDMVQSDKAAKKEKFKTLHINLVNLQGSPERRKFSDDSDNSRVSKTDYNMNLDTVFKNKPKTKERFEQPPRVTFGGQFLSEDDQEQVHIPSPNRRRKEMQPTNLVGKVLPKQSISRRQVVTRGDSSNSLSLSPMSKQKVSNEPELAGIGIAKRTLTDHLNKTKALSVKEFEMQHREFSQQMHTQISQLNKLIFTSNQNNVKELDQRMIDLFKPYQNQFKSMSDQVFQLHSEVQSIRDKLAKLGKLEYLEGEIERIESLIKGLQNPIGISTIASSYGHETNSVAAEGFPKVLFTSVTPRTATAGAGKRGRVIHTNQTISGNFINKRGGSVIPQQADDAKITFPTSLHNALKIEKSNLGEEKAPRKIMETLNLSSATYLLRRTAGVNSNR